MSRHRTVAALAVLGGLLLAPQALPASATTSAASGGTDRALVLAAPQPATDRTWLQGVLTDQAGRPLDGVNVEILTTGTPATIVASNLTYAGADARHEHGAWRVEVPFGTYQIRFSEPSGNVTDAFRTTWFNGKKTIKVEKSGVRRFGTTELVHDGAVASKTVAKLSPTKVKAGKAGKVTVTVTSYWVSPVVGKVSVAVGGKKVFGTLGETSNGKITLTLPKLKKPGKYTVETWFLGTGDSVKKSSTKTKLTVTKK